MVGKVCGLHRIRHYGSVVRQIRYYTINIIQVIVQVLDWVAFVCYKGYSYLLMQPYITATATVIHQVKLQS